MTPAQRAAINAQRRDYHIVRFYFNAGIRKRTIRTGLTLDEAQAHCQDVQSSSSTCTNAVGRARTRNVGPWFDGYSS